MNTMEKIQRLKQHTYSLMRHLYVEDYIQPPVFDEAKVFVAYSLLSELGLDETAEAEYFSAILLIQSALDRHERILDEDVASHKKRRQLIVLSGDYFSSLYYSLLSNCEDIQLISSLSKAVQNINENKARLHDPSTLPVNSTEWLKTVLRIESLLYTNAARSFGLHKYNEFIETYLLLSRYPNHETRRALSDEQLTHLKKCETLIRAEEFEMPLLFAREGWHRFCFMENDLMLGEG
jgi:heptaprenyl diphosphate synthase